MLRRVNWSTADAAERKAVLERPALSSDAVDVAREIVSTVRKQGETAVRAYAQQLDDWAPEAGFRVPETDLAAAAAELPGEDRDAIMAAAAAVRAFHAQQGYREYEVQTWPGVRARRRATPIDIAGLYVPAGTAPLVSTLIMLSVPARLAGVPRVALITPPRKGRGVEPIVLAAAWLLGVKEVYALGGAHGIAALGLGVAGLPRADRIFGPGNAYVAASKAFLAHSPDGAAVDLPAGPSEVMVIADDMADPELTAIDLLSQAEHDQLAQVVLAARSGRFVDEVEAAIEILLARLPRADTVCAALAHSRAVIVSGEAQAIEVANAYAPEHLIIQTGDPEGFALKVRHAGSIFLGPWTPEAAGDYAAGPSHVLPTAGAARAYGGVTVEMFQKTTTLVELNAEGVRAIAPVVERLAALEGLDAHRLAMKLRRGKLQEMR